MAQKNVKQRDPKSLAKPKIKDENDMSSNKYNEKFEGKAKAMRYIALIRHGQYHKNGRIDERVLTKLGRKQAEATGKRLAELNLPYSLVVRSTMTRAQETSKIIEKYLANVPVEDDRLLIEGSFSPPEQMPFVCWKLEKHFSQYRPKIEAAFRKYFHRAEPSQNRDSYTVLVCHRNVIRYFVCRVSHVPWSEIWIKHASITWLCILPSGTVTLFCLGDTEHMLLQDVTY